MRISYLLRRRRRSMRSFVVLNHVDHGGRIKCSSARPCCSMLCLFRIIPFNCVSLFIILSNHLTLLSSPYISDSFIIATTIQINISKMPATRFTKTRPRLNRRLGSRHQRSSYQPSQDYYLKRYQNSRSRPTIRYR